VKRLPVDLAELANLFDQPRRGPVRAFFDRATGELESMPRDAEVEGVFDDILADPGRWVEILPLAAVQRLELRRQFVEREVSDPHLRLRLAEALQRDRPFTRFEAVLRDGPPLLERWLDFRAEALASLLRAWLSALAVEPGSPPRPTVDS
jgi:hypothetical protein